MPSLEETIGDDAPRMHLVSDPVDCVHALFEAVSEEIHLSGGGGRSVATDDLQTLPLFQPVPGEFLLCLQIALIS